MRRELLHCEDPIGVEGPALGEPGSGFRGNQSLTSIGAVAVSPHIIRDMITDLSNIVSIMLITKDNAKRH